MVETDLAKFAMKRDYSLLVRLFVSKSLNGRLCRSQIAQDRPKRLKCVRVLSRRRVDQSRQSLFAHREQSGDVLEIMPSRFGAHLRVANCDCLVVRQ